jgi:hypothetical protein
MFHHQRALHFSGLSSRYSKDKQWPSGGVTVDILGALQLCAACTYCIGGLQLITVHPAPTYPADIETVVFIDPAFPETRHRALFVRLGIVTLTSNNSNPH